MTSPLEARLNLPDALQRALDEGLAIDGRSTELRDLVVLARALELSAPSVLPSPHFRAAARERLLASIAAQPVRLKRRVRRTARDARTRLAVWLGRFAAGAATLSFAGAAAAGASANTIPGDLMYPVKQAIEFVALETARTDDARQDLLVRHADARLDETQRLLELGHIDEAAETVRRLNATLETATIEDADGRADGQAVAPRLEAAQARLSSILESAPAPARPGLERALEVTQRASGRESLPAVSPDVERAPTHPGPPAGESHENAADQPRNNSAPSPAPAPVSATSEHASAPARKLEPNGVVRHGRR